MEHQESINDGGEQEKKAHTHSIGWRLHFDYKYSMSLCAENSIIRYAAHLPTHTNTIEYFVFCMKFSVRPNVNICE